MSGKCCCVTSVAYLVAPNLLGQVNTRCWNCGDYVCTACSQLMAWRPGRRLMRICDNCRHDREYDRSRGRR